MKELPILFSTPMVLAILKDEKSMTRRTNGLEEINENPDDWQFEWADYYLKKPWRFTQKSTVNKQSLEDRSFNQAALKCPYGWSGDILWVRETWRKSDFPDVFGEFEYKSGLDNCDAPWNQNIWKPSIHMPKEAAKIWLEITSIKPQRLHDISDENIIAEGVRIPVNGIGTGRVLLALGEKNTAIDFLPSGCLAKGAPKLTQTQLLHAFWAELWCKINGRESWDKNPWVWAIEFKVLSTTGKPENL